MTMDKRWTTVAAIVATLLVMTGPPLAVGQDMGQPNEIDPGFIPRILPTWPAGQVAGQRPAAQPDFTLRVWVNKDFNDDTDAGKQTAALQVQIRDFLNKARLGVPEDRVRFFEPLWVNCPPISGWNGMVYKVAPINGGYAVTLSISAEEGGGVGDSTRLYEHYTIVGGKVKYRGCTLPPPGWLRFRGN